MEDYRYWYGNAIRGGGSSLSGSSIPTQALPLKKKNEKWRRSCMDAFESIGKAQVRENSKYADIFRMIDGHMSYSELSEVMPQYRELEEILGNAEMNTWVRHYDLIGVIINALAGELSANSDKYSINTIDEVSTNEYIRVKTDRLYDFIQTEFSKGVELRLLSMGINPGIPDEAFQSQEELEAYKQQIQQKRAEMTPPQIEQYMKTTWKTVAAKWAAMKLDEDTLNHDMSNIDNENFVQFLASGRCFVHMYVGYDYYKPEVWHILNTFYSKDIDNKFPQHGDYIGRVHKLTRSQIVNRYGHKLTQKEQEIILKGTESGPSGPWEDNFFGPNSNVSYKKMFDSHFHSMQVVAFPDEPEYKLALDIQDSLGIPMGERMVVGRSGEYEKVPVPLPSLSPTGDWGLGNGGIDVYSSMRNDITLRTDLITVTEVYWRSFKRVGYLKYFAPDGQEMSTIVSEELLPEFLSYNGISQPKDIPLSKLEEKQDENTIVWVYQPEVWEGVKINIEGDPIYVDVKPCDYQIKGDGNIYDVLLPVAGIVDTSLAQKIEPYQVMYNVIMNQIFNLLEKEIGLFYIFDINFLPSEFKDWGDTEDTLLHMRDIAKDIGIVPVDSSKQNLVGGANFNQFAAQNLSFSAQISDRIQLAEFVKNKAFEQVGVTPQRLGAPNKYETTEGIKVSQDASYAQTERYFSKFSTFKKKALELHLNVAQACQRDGKDLQLYYTQSDATQAFMKEVDEDFNLRRFSIVPISNSKKREELKTFKSWVMNTNTIGTDELAMAEIISSGSIAEIIEASRSARLAREQQQQQQIQAQGEQQRQTMALKEQLEQRKWEREEFSKDKDRQNRLEEETIGALGRAADKNTDTEGANLILQQAKLSIEGAKAEAGATNKQMENNIKQQQLDLEKAKQMDDAKIKMAELAARLQISRDNKEIARVNKN